MSPNIPSPGRRASALRIVADILDERRNAALVAEIAAPVPGETGGEDVIASWQAFLEEPPETLRDLASELEDDQPPPPRSIMRDAKEEAESITNEGADNRTEQMLEMVMWTLDQIDGHVIPLPDADECTCTIHEQDAGAGYREQLMEYDPACPEHSEHVYNPRKGEWERSAPADRVEALKKLHSPVPGEHDGLPVPGEHYSVPFSDPGPYCSHCSTVDEPVPHPCTTIEVLDGLDLEEKRRQRIERNRQRYGSQHLEEL